MQSAECQFVEWQFVEWQFVEWQFVECQFVDWQCSECSIDPCSAGRSFMITEYCPRGSLQDILEDSDFELDMDFRRVFTCTHPPLTPRDGGVYLGFRG